MNFDSIFFIGPQGSGKGTQAKKLANKLGFFYWEMGAILRGIEHEKTDFGRKVLELISRGDLLDDEYLFQIVREKMPEVDLKSGVIFDGIPRRLAQAEFLLDYLIKDGHKSFATIHIDIPYELSLSRSLSRGKLEKRADDNEETITYRLNLYQQNTVPVLEYLKSKTTFFKIDGTPSVDEVTTEINMDLEV